MKGVSSVRWALMWTSAQTEHEDSSCQPSLHVESRLAVDRSYPKGSGTAVNFMNCRILSRIGSILLAFLLVAVLPSCSKNGDGRSQAGQPKPVSTVIAAKAENFASDASFAMQIRDYARAEEGLISALKLRSDIPEWQEALGLACKMQGKTSEARSSYKKALSLWEDRYEASNDMGAAMRQVVLLVLLDKESDARALLVRLAKKHPQDPALQNFIQNKALDRMLSDPEIQKKKV